MVNSERTLHSNDSQQPQNANQSIPDINAAEVRQRRHTGTVPLR